MFADALLPLCNPPFAIIGYFTIRVALNLFFLYFSIPLSNEPWRVFTSIMSEDALQEKTAYFDQQELSDKDDDAHPLSEAYLQIRRILEEPKVMSPPKVTRQSSSFLGPTPKEQLKRLESLRTNQLSSSSSSSESSGLKRASTAPEPKMLQSFPAGKGRQRPMTSSAGEGAQKILERTVSLPDTLSQDGTPFHKQVGSIPRELKNGKNVKLANDIKLEPENRQVLKGKKIYFYPNDDISMPRRQRIHKIIQLGAAWIKVWREDVTHIMVDDYSYSQVLRHLNKIALPVSIYSMVKLVNFCIDDNTTAAASGPGEIRSLCSTVYPIRNTT